MITCTLAHERLRKSSLPRGVAAADDGNRPGSAGLGLRLRRRVVHPDALELGQAVQGKPVVPGACSDDHRPGLNGLAVIEGDKVHAVLDRQRSSFRGQLDADPELLRLQRPPGREFFPGQPCGKTEVVLDT
jgi:hypothetical protein